MSSSSSQPVPGPESLHGQLLNKLLDFPPNLSQRTTRQTWHLSPNWTWDARGGPKGQIHSRPDEFRDAGGEEYGDFTPNKTSSLGRGVSGQVVRVLCNGRILARKQTSIDPKYEEEMIGNMEEINVMKNLSHQHIAQLCGLYVLEETLFTLYYPVAEMDLMKYLELNKIYDPTWVHSLVGGMGCLSNALTYSHAAGIKHEDIHTGNILVLGGVLIFCDWGASRLDYSHSHVSTFVY